MLLKLTDVDEAEAELKRWLWKASHSRIPAFKELYQKIKRHKTHILNTIRYGISHKFWHFAQKQGVTGKGVYSNKICIRNNCFLY